MIVDSSMILAILFDAHHAGWAAEQLQTHARELRMSTVALAQTLARLRDRQPALADGLEHKLLTSGIRFIAPDSAQATVAAKARLRYELNLGDCFTYALAMVESCPILTLNAAFRAVDCPVVLPPAMHAPHHG
jgi:uncharacterized protein with PIN domain